MGNRYKFTNFSDEPFDGKMGGVPQHFEPGETKEYDQDKHGMLVVMAKHLADRELLKEIKSVGRNPNNEETWAKSLDKDGKPYAITSDMRKELMRKAVGALVDTPVPIPEEVTPEGGATERMSTDVSQLQGKVEELTEIIASLTAQVGKMASGNGSGTSPPAPDEPAPQPEAPLEAPSEESPSAEPQQSIAREALLEMAKEAGLPTHEGMTKQEIIELLNKDTVVSHPVGI